MESKIQFEFNERKVSTLFNGHVVGNNHQLPTSDFVNIGQDPRELIHAILFRPEQNIIIQGEADNKPIPIQHTTNLRGKTLYIDQNSFSGVHLTRANDITQLQWAEWIDAPNQLELDEHPGIGPRQISYTHYQWQESELGLTCFATMDRGNFDGFPIESSGGVIYHFGLWPDGSFANEMEPNVQDPVVMESLKFLTKDLDGNPFYSSGFLDTFTYMTGFFYHGLDNFNFYVIRHNSLPVPAGFFQVGDSSTLFMYRIDGQESFIEYPIKNFDGLSYVLHSGKSDDSESLMMTSFEPVTPTVEGVPAPGFLQRIHYFIPSTMILDFVTPPVINFIEMLHLPFMVDIEFDMAPGKIVEEKQVLTLPSIYFQRNVLPAFISNQFGFKSPYSPQYILDDKLSYTTVWLDNFQGNNIFTYQQVRDVYQENNNVYFVNAGIIGFPIAFLFDFTVWPQFPPTPKIILTPNNPFPAIAFSPGFFNGDDWNYLNRRYSTREWLGMVQEPLGSLPVVNHSIEVGKDFQPDLSYALNVPAAISSGYLGRNHLFNNGSLRNIIYDSISNDINNKVFAEGCEIINCLIRSSLINTNFILHNCNIEFSWVQDSFGGIGQALPIGKLCENSIFTDIEEPTGDGNTEINISTFHRCGVVGGQNGSYTGLIISLGLSPDGATFIDMPPNFATFTDCIIQPSILTGIPLPSVTGYVNLTVANAQYIAPTKPYSLHLKSIVKGYALDSPALAYTSIPSFWGGNREAGAYDDRNDANSISERIWVDAPWEAQIVTNAKIKTNVIESGSNAIGKLNKLYIEIKFKWSLVINEKEREKIYRMLNSEINSIKYWPKPLEFPNQYLTGFIKPRVEISNVKAQVENNAKKMILTAIFETPDTKEINDFL